MWLKECIKSKEFLAKNKEISKKDYLFIEFYSFWAAKLVITINKYTIQTRTL